MGLYKIIAIQTGTWGGVKIEKGMSVEVVYPNPPLSYPEGKELARKEFLFKYGKDYKNLLSQTYFSVEKIK